MKLCPACETDSHIVLGLVPSCLFAPFLGTVRHRDDNKTPPQRFQRLSDPEVADIRVACSNELCPNHFPLAIAVPRLSQLTI